MVCFQTKNPNLGKFWTVLQWKMLVYFIWTLCPFYGLLLYLMHIWCSSWYFGIFFPVLVRLEQEKSGNPALTHSRVLNHGANACSCFPETAAEFDDESLTFDMVRADEPVYGAAQNEALNFKVPILNMKADT
jgi:hypothetical protein